MKRAVLEGLKDGETGDIGLVVVGMPRLAGQIMVMLDGEGVAHDVVEHVNGVAHIGTIADEMQALGAMWHVRGRWGDLSRTRSSMYSPEENMAADVVRMFVDHVNSPESAMCSAPKTRRCDDDDALAHILDIAERDYPAELSGDALREARREWPRFARAALAYMRRGYRKAAKRYGSGYDGHGLFFKIAEAVRPYARYAIEGQRYILRYGFDRDGRPAATCEETYRDADYM